jgi:hypothetical protein
MDGRMEEVREEGMEKGRKGEREGRIAKVVSARGAVEIGWRGGATRGRAHVGEFIRPQTCCNRLPSRGIRMRIDVLEGRGQERRVRFSRRGHSDWGTLVPGSDVGMSKALTYFQRSPRATWSCPKGPAGADRGEFTRHHLIMPREGMRSYGHDKSPVGHRPPKMRSSRPRGRKKPCPKRRCHYDVL